MSRILRAVQNVFTKEVLNENKMNIHSRIQIRGSEPCAGSRLFNFSSLSCFRCWQTALKHWGEQLQLERTGQAPTATASTPKQREIQQLKARIHQLEQEKTILKKLQLY